jgi:hypothetical protein
MIRDTIIPTRAELAAERDRCPECGEPTESGTCVVLSCVGYERAVHGPILYEVQFSGWSVPCATLRRAIEVRAGQGWSRIVRADYIPNDCDDDGLSQYERDAIDAPEGEGRDILIAVIDSLPRATEAA